MNTSHFINRELSWLEFNQRVLDLAGRQDVPLLERVKFLAISSSNLSEFLMVRVGGLKVVVAEGGTKTDPAGLSPAEQLEAVGERMRKMVADQYACWEVLERELAGHGIVRVRAEDLSEEQHAHLDAVFESEVFPVLSPMAVTRDFGIPTLSNLWLHVGVRLKPDPAGGKVPRYAVVPIAKTMSRLIVLPAAGGYRFMPVEDVVALFIDRLFPGEEITECVPFRITRNADLAIDEDLAADMLSGMEEVLTARKRSDCICLEVHEKMTRGFLRFLRGALRVGEQDVFAVSGLPDLSALSSLPQLPGWRELKDKPWPPQPPPDIQARDSMFEVLTERDVLLSHPYESFEPVVRFVNEAADDPDVLAIKQILYRTSRESPIVAALMRAAGRGKHVTVIVELKARFDEARNIEWARAMEDAGVQVIYGVKRLKTHAKLCLVIRREPQGIRRYMHFGTGNYNEATARLYTDVSYMTCDEDLGRDASTFFNFITGYSQPQALRKLEAAPITLRERVIELIDGEAERRRQGQKAAIMAKLNSLADPAIIGALYAAAKAGVKIQLNVRGICCLRPGLRGLSTNIRVVSTVDRFLEHSRIIWFLRGGEEQVYISSADWMPRNLDRRVELMTPVGAPEHKRRLRGMLEAMFADTTNTWQLRGNGQYRRVSAGGRRPRSRSQEAQYEVACERTQQARQMQRTVFEAHRPPGVVD